jgi:hypothetical protein
VNSFDPRTQSAVLVEPVGTRQMPATNELDVRIEKMFRLRSAATAGVYANIFNATNRIVAAQVIQNSGSAFGAVTLWTQPRRFRVGVRVTF